MSALEIVRQVRRHLEESGRLSMIRREFALDDDTLAEVVALAEAHLVLGEHTEALATAREAIDLGRVGGSRYVEAEAQLTLAGALLATDGLVPRAEIEAALGRAEQLVESIAGRALSPRIVEKRARLAAALGDEPAADQALRQSLDLYRAIGAAGHGARLEQELGASSRPA